MSRSFRIQRIVGALVVPVLLAALSGLAFGAPPVNVKAGKFVSAGEKGAMKAMRMRAGYAGPAAAKALGDKLNKAAKFEDAIELKADKANHMVHVSKSDPSAHFRIDITTGDFSYSKGLKGYLDGGAVGGLPDKDRAVELAKTYLTDLGVMPEKQNEMVVRHVGGMKQADLNQDGTTTEHDKLVSVHFGRQIDGIDVSGPGSKIVVELGADGELVTLTKRWIEVTEEKKGGPDFHQQADVVNAMRAKLQRDGSKGKSIDASAPEFGYFDDGKGNIEPAYFFTADIAYDVDDGKGGKAAFTEKYHGAVAALRSSKADFEQVEKAKGPPGAAARPAQDKPSVKD